MGLELCANYHSDCRTPRSGRVCLADSLPLRSQRDVPRFPSFLNVRNGSKHGYSVDKLCFLLAVRLWFHAHNVFASSPSLPEIVTGF